jgi:hypothetical protein
LVIINCRGAVETLDLLLKRSRGSSSVEFTTNSSVSFKTMRTETQGVPAQMSAPKCEAESTPTYVRFSGGDTKIASTPPTSDDNVFDESTDKSYIFSTGDSEF